MPQFQNHIFEASLKVFHDLQNQKPFLDREEQHTIRLYNAAMLYSNGRMEGSKTRLMFRLKLLSSEIIVYLVV